MGDFDFSTCVLCVFIGVFIAAVYTFYSKHIIGSFVRMIMERGCNSVENGLTLRELGFDRNTFVRSAIRPESTLMRVVGFYSPSYDGTAAVKRVNGKKVGAINLDDAVFFIDEKNAEKAFRTYDSKGSTWFSVVLTAVILAIVFALTTVLVPLFVDFSQNIIGIFTSDTDELIKITGTEGYDFSDVIEKEKEEQEKEAERKARQNKSANASDAD